MNFRGFREGVMNFFRLGGVLNFSVAKARTRVDHPMDTYEIMIHLKILRQNGIITKIGILSNYLIKKCR